MYSKISDEDGEGLFENRHGTGETRYKCLVLTDSNGRGATADSIKSHMPVTERSRYDIEVVVAYRLEEAYYRIRRGEIDVKDSYVIIDNITNNVRGGRNSPGEPPERVINQIACLRDLILSLSAAAVVVCQIKPMAVVDVRPYNQLLHNYLGSCGEGNYGCTTQIRMDYLAADGFHVNHRYSTIIDRTYACALLGTPVPCPTSDDDFVPPIMRRRYETQWPRLEGSRGMGTTGS